MAVGSINALIPQRPAALDEVQRLIMAVREQYDLRVTPQVALLDACAELGELAGAYLKQCGYAPATTPDAAASPPTPQVQAEFGDALFALLSFAGAAGLDSAAQLAATLARYEVRFADRRSGEDKADRHG